MKITFCIFNEQRNQVIPILKNSYPELELSLAKCIYCCGECSEKLIARIKGQLIVADTTKEFINKIENMI